VKSVNEKLKAVFGLEYGLADTTTWAEMVSSGRAEYPVDPNTGKTNKEWIDNIKGRAFVQILDPATGTGTFIKHTIDIIYNEVKSKHNKDKIKIPWIEYWNDYVYKNLLTRIYGFELMMASYSVAHMKLGMHLKSTGYKFEKNQRLNVYLTNSLEPYSSNSNANLFFTSVGAESIGANEVKKNRFFSVIIGNPPYNAMSKNQNDWIMTLMEDYKKEPGPGNKKLKERNPKMINDDYVKFIRLSQYLLERNKSGIIAFINPHGFINSDTFRGVRWSLVNNFNSIYICDLHGNTKKNISSSKGIKDENVFDITQGVGINIFVRNSKLTSKNLGDVKYKSLVGNREFKYSYLSSNELTNIDFENIHLNEPKYNFINFKMKGDDYFSFIAINDLFRFNSTGLQTDKDDFCIKFQKEELMNQWKDIQDHNADELRIKYELGEDTSSWSLKNAISDIKKSKIHIDKISLIQYRPFDIRYSYYTGNSNGFMGRPRRELVQHLTEISNCSLITIKNSRSSSGWNFIFASKFIPTKPTSITSLDANYVFPLYLNSDKTTKLDFENNHLNLNPEYISKIAKKLGIKFSDGQSIDDNSFSPFDIFDFVYGVLHSPSYREKYDELLKTDFPRIPYPKNQDIFWRLVKTGRELRQIHLLESASVDNIIISFPVLGNNEVLKSPEYNNNKVYINNEQYFDGVPEIAWNSYIGGYQPAQKWLKDRKGLSITAEEINHYKKIIIALIETTRIMNEIDKIDFMEGELNADYPTQVDDFQVAADSGA
jgi:predicted helicase